MKNDHETDKLPDDSALIISPMSVSAVFLEVFVPTL